MGFKDLREFIQRVDQLGELRRVSGADCNLEIGAITEIAAGSLACRPLFRRASFPAVVEVSPEYKAEILLKWRDVLK